MEVVKDSPAEEVREGEQCAERRHELVLTDVRSTELELLEEPVKSSPINGRTDGRTDGQ